MKISKSLLSFTAALLLSGAYFLPISNPAVAQETHAEEGGDHEDGEEHGEEEGAIEMDEADRRKNGVFTSRIGFQEVGGEVSATGEVILNQYKTTRVTPRISAQIIQRHKKLGDNVSKGTSLVTLTSVELAEAQGQAIASAQEWARVKALGKDIVTERRYVEAQISAQLSKAKIAAYGMTSGAVDRLINVGDAAKATGTFTLNSKQNGTVMHDDFIIGDIVEPGRILFEVSDESKAWVNVRLSADDAASIEVGTDVRLKAGNGAWTNGKVLQLNHQVDEETRTFSVRVETDNADDNLHAGQFVTAFLQVGKSEPTLSVPVDAVTQLEGDDVVFVVEGDELHATPVQLGVKRGDWVEVKSGVDVGTEIATSEIFLLKSLMLKSKMGSGHGH